MMINPELLTPIEAADLLGVPVRAVYTMLDDAVLTIVRIKDERPGTIRVRRSEVERAIADRSPT